MQPCYYLKADTRGCFFFYRLINTAFGLGKPHATNASTQQKQLRMSLTLRLTIPQQRSQVRANVGLTVRGSEKAVEIVLVFNSTD